MDLPEKGWLVLPEEGVMRHATRSPWLGKNGYFYFDEKEGGRKVKRLVHRAIWEAVHGPIAYGLVINHINGIKADNRIVNLELVTPRGNNRHARATGLNQARGENAGNAHLTEDEVRLIAAAQGTQTAVAARFGVSRTAIKDIWRGATWRHLGLPVRARRTNAPPFRASALTERIVTEARCRAANGETVGGIARDLGVNVSTLVKAVSGYSWKHLPGAFHG